MKINTLRSANFFHGFQHGKIMLCSVYK